MRVVFALLVLAPLLAAFGGCRHRYDPVHNPARIERFERNLIRLAARDSGCAEVQVQPVRIGETLWVANTCTGPREYFLGCRARGRRWSHCRWRRIDTVAEAAAPALQCPAAQVGQQLGASPHERVAVGCGRQVAMQLQCNQVGCGWIALATAPPAPAPSSGGAVIVIVPPPD